jgi:hypothetical protein
MAQMKPNSVAVFNSNDIYPVSAEYVAICTAPRHLLLKWADQEAFYCYFQMHLMSINEK